MPFFLVGSPIVDASRLFAEMVQHGLRCITFCKSRKLCELVLSYTYVKSILFIWEVQYFMGALSCSGFFFTYFLLYIFLTIICWFSNWESNGYVILNWKSYLMQLITLKFKCYRREILHETAPHLVNSICAYRGGYIAEVNFISFLPSF